MKLYLLLPFLFCSFFSSKAQDQKNNYSIDGTVPGVKTGKVYLMEFVSDGTWDSAFMKNGSFHFTGRLQNPMPMLFRAEGGKGSFLFFADKAKMRLTIDKDSLENSKLAGSSSQKDFLAYGQKTKSQNDRLNQLSAWSRSQGKLSKARQDSITHVWDIIDAERKDSVGVFLKYYPNSVVAAFAITRHFLIEPDVTALEAQYKALSPKVRQSTFGKQIKEKLDVERATAVGNAALNFSQSDTLGKQVSLNDFKGKYVLLDFWASWCVPCRQENPNVVMAYKKYRDKGFDILSVSLDDKKDGWLKAIQQDGLIWTHVSELQEWNNSAAKLYGVNAIPSNFLLDPRGIIIAKNLKGQKLQEKLAEVLK